MKIVKYNSTDLLSRYNYNYLTNLCMYETSINKLSITLFNNQEYSGFIEIEVSCMYITTQKFYWFLLE